MRYYTKAIDKSTGKVSYCAHPTLKSALYAAQIVGGLRVVAIHEDGREVQLKVPQ